MNEKQLDSHAIRLSTLLTQVLIAQENECRTITHALQENIGQSLAALALHLRVAENTSDLAQRTALLAEARGLVAGALHEIEGLVRHLNPPALEAQGIGPALEVYVQDFAKREQLNVELNLEVLPSRPSPDVELALFRIAQEALQNVSCHAYATAVRIDLYLRGDYVHLLIEDDGVGYPHEALSGWGFLRMTQRAEMLGGHCTFVAAQGQGARVEVTIPRKGSKQP